MDCHVAALLAMTIRAGVSAHGCRFTPRHCERSAAIQCGREMPGPWIATSLTLFALTIRARVSAHGCRPTPRHCERSAAIQCGRGMPGPVDCHVADDEGSSQFARLPTYSPLLRAKRGNPVRTGNAGAVDCRVVDALRTDDKGSSQCARLPTYSPSLRAKRGNLVRAGHAGAMDCRVVDALREDGNGRAPVLVLSDSGWP